MQITYSSGQPETVLAEIVEKIGGRKLSKILNLSLDNGGLRVVISKLGTSQLDFSCTPKEEGFIWTLEREKIALAHRAKKGEIVDKIVKVVQETGGRVS